MASDTAPLSSAAGFDLLAAAVGEGAITLDEAEVLMGELVAAPDDDGDSAVLARLPAAWLTGRDTRAAKMSTASERPAVVPHEFLTLSGVCGGVTALCTTIWLATGAGYFWPLWPAMGTAIPAAIALKDQWRARAAAKRLP